MSLIPFGSVIGIIGGGQLARMMSVAATNLGYKTCIYSDIDQAPAFYNSNLQLVGDYDDLRVIDKFISLVSVVTFEFENIPSETLSYIASKILVRPNVLSLEISQDRIKEKNFFNQNSIQTAKFLEVKTFIEFKEACRKFGNQAILKTTRLGYDGKGQFSIDEKENLEKIWQAAIDLKLPLILEERVNFTRELSIIAARDTFGQIVCYPLVENIHQSGILRKSIFPAKVNSELQKNAEKIVISTLTKLDYVGLLAIEFFETEAGLLVNEFAPRPHNSGHYSIDAASHSQFEQSIRAIIGLPVLTPQIYVSGEMINLIGDEILQLEDLAKNPHIKIHNYDKNEIKALRKMGHYTFLDK